MKKIRLGLLLGLVAGIIDVVPMILMGLTWDANFSVFAFWVVAGFFISATDMRLRGALKGLVISLVLLVPLAFLIGWHDPVSLLPILAMNVVLGSSLGFLIDKYGK